MSKRDRISGIPWFLFSVFITVESYRLGLGALHQPGPGFLYFWSGIVLGIMSLWVLMRAWGRKIAAAEGPILKGANVSKVSLILVSCFTYAYLLETIGFIPLTFLLFFFILGVVEKKRLQFTTCVSFTVTLVTYLIFEIWLKTQLPKGLLDRFGF